MRSRAVTRSAPNRSMSLTTTPISSALSPKDRRLSATVRMISGYTIPLRDSA